MSKYKSIKRKQLLHQWSRSRAEMKKRSPQFKKKRRNRLQERRLGIIREREFANRDYFPIIVPSNFSFIDNTDEMLQFIYNCQEALRINEKVECDLSKIDSLSSDAIALLAACTNDRTFLGKRGKIKGNAPKHADLQKTFIESGFYNHVNASKSLKGAHRKDNNLFHQESHFKVESDIAKKACLLGTRHVLGNERPFEDLFEMLVESMSNTNNHASNQQKDRQIKWWLYTYNNPNGNTQYTFIDLGIGIFDSVPATKFKRVKKALGFSHNVDIVSDLLEGRIKSREEVDNDMRGKGIPQIASNSKNPMFKRAYIISNDVKINLKSGTAEKLEANFLGTLLFWELGQNL